MPTNVADTSTNRPFIESHAREQFVKAVRTVAMIDRSWLTILLLRIAREYDAGEERYSANVEEIRDERRKSVLLQRLLPAGKRGPVRSPITGFRKVQGVDPAHATYAG